MLRKMTGITANFSVFLHKDILSSPKAARINTAKEEGYKYLGP